METAKQFSVMLFGSWELSSDTVQYLSRDKYTWNLISFSTASLNSLFVNALWSRNMSYMDYEKLAVFGHPSRCINATKLSLHLRDKNSIFPVSIEFIVDSRTAKMESKMYMLIAVVAVILEPSFSQGKKISLPSIYSI